MYAYIYIQTYIIVVLKYRCLDWGSIQGRHLRSQKAVTGALGASIYMLFRAKGSHANPKSLNFCLVKYGKQPDPCYFESQL